MKIEQIDRDAERKKMECEQDFRERLDRAREMIAKKQRGVR